MHAWPALHCLTVVFSRCHRLTAPCRGDGIMCSGAGAEWRREQSRGAPRPRHSRLPRHLIVRKVSAGPSEPGASAAALSAGARLKGTASLGRAHSFQSLRGFVS